MSDPLEPCFHDPCDRARRHLLCAGAALGAALLLPARARAAQVHGLKGKVAVNGRPAQRGTVIKASDHVVTGAGGEIVFVIGQDAFLLRASSDLQLQRSSSGNSELIGGLRLLTGALLAVFGPGPRRLSTSTATIGIRGTGVYIEASPRQTYFCACYGDVEISDSKGKERRRIISGHHTPAMIYADTQGGRMLGEATMKNHTDAEVIMLDRLVGRIPPFLQRQKQLDDAAAQTRRDEEAAARSAPPQSVPEPAPRPPESASRPANPAPRAPEPMPARPLPSTNTAVQTPPPLTESPALDPVELEWRLPPPRPQ
jgi:hypothetical protein